ncbi:MAG: hypothetical protein IKX45_03000 [Bacteroidales bacterium]|nr:hypothetical protein [Bacteroidales bacterium]
MATIQAGIRMDSSLYERLKRNAKKQKRSLNNYVVALLEEATAPIFPHIEEKDLIVDQDLLLLGETFGELSREFSESNPKLAYILSK